MSTELEMPIINFHSTPCFCRLFLFPKTPHSLLRWPTGDMQHALSLAQTKSDCCTQNQKSPTNLLSMHKVDAHKFELLHTKWVLQHTNSDLLHTKWVLEHAKSVAVVAMLAFTSH